MTRSRRVSICALILLHCAATTAFGQAPPTVWHALGIPQGWARWRDGNLNRRGNRPNRERKPPLKALADPANLKSDVPAIKAAAEIKAQQDLAPQKIKAIKYLAQIGCGCYGGVAEALMAALEDCTEVVRLAAAEALEEATLGDPCEFCEGTCCTPELAEKMYERAYGRDANGCYLEPSERVRAVLERAVAGCPPESGKGSSVVPIDPLIDPVRPDSPIPTPSIDGRPVDPAGTLIDPLAPGLLQYDALPGDSSSSNSGSSRRGQQQPTPAGRNANVPSVNARADFERYAPPVDMVPVEVCGEVTDTRTAKGYVRLVFEDNRRPPVGTEVEVYHEYVLGTEMAGTLVIRDWEGNHAIAAPRAWGDVKVSRGDHVHCVMQVPAAAQPPLPPEVRTASAKPAAAPATAAAPAPVVTAQAAAPEKTASGVQRIFTLSTEKAAGQPTPARSVTGAAISKAVPSSRRTATPAARPAPAPVVKSSDAGKSAHVAPPAVGPVTRPATAAAPPQQRPSVSGALADMLRLPGSQATPQSRPAAQPAASVNRPARNVMPASANLPADSASGTERLPPIVTPSEFGR